ncbi:ABC transporter permease [Roseivirga pacifica]|uniref:ABC transporter permease n=1 Tax=Roseivirga pacifica TaxID=1267423 RepID=UPI00227B00F5|nr:ABC transporter permease [Roseivirga pacifica]
MNLPYFISKRINASDKGSFSSIIHKIAIASVALGIAIMLVSFQILGGFQNSIKDKIFSFSGHIQIKAFTFSSEYEQTPIVIEGERMEMLQDDPHVKHFQEFAFKPGLISQNEEVFGMLFKGVSQSFDTIRFADYLVEGSMLTFDEEEAYPNEILLSERMARQMQVEVGDRIVSYFIMDPPRTRSFFVKGIFSSGLEDFDEQIVIGDIKVVRTLNGWEDNEVGGYEVFINDLDKLEEADDSILQRLSVNQTTERVDQKFVQVFDWLNLLSQNVFILIGLILFVACFNMVSVLFILIMERRPMIGSFKALGATDKLIRSIFTYNGVRLVVRGLIIGNVIGLVFGFLQYQFKLIPLDPATYYMSHVPIDWNWFRILGINALTFLLVGVVLLLPTAIISRISPVKAIRFD